MCYINNTSDGDDIYILGITFTIHRANEAAVIRVDYGKINIIIYYYRDFLHIVYYP